LRITLERYGAGGRVLLRIEDREHVVSFPSRSPYTVLANCLLQIVSRTVENKWRAVDINIADKAVSAFIEEILKFNPASREGRAMGLLAQKVLPLLLQSTDVEVTVLPRPFPERPSVLLRWIRQKNEDLKKVRDALEENEFLTIRDVMGLLNCGYRRARDLMMLLPTLDPSYVYVRGILMKK